MLWVGTTRGLVAIAPDGSTRRFDVDSGLPAVPVRAIVSDKDGVLWVGTPNGLARRDGDRFVHVSTPALRSGIVVWDLDPARWSEAACELASRNLTREEWETYIGDLASYRATCPQFDS